jgi:hypothetical protein
MRASKRPHLTSRHRSATVRRPRGHRDALMRVAYEYEDDEEAIVGPGNDRADGQD